MRPKLLRETLLGLAKINRTVCIEGSPGIGKTSIVHTLAPDLGDANVSEVNIATMPVEDMGVPMIDKPSLYYKLPDWFPAVGSIWDNGRKTLLVLDDCNQAGPDHQKIVANICQARNLHGVPMVDDCMVIMTGNRVEDRAGASKVLTHLRNRQTVLDFEVSRDDWLDWAMANGIKPELSAFFHFRPGLLNDFKPDRGINATPRSWMEGVNDVIGCIPPEAEYEVYKGAVGEGPATEFLAYLKVWRSLPSVTAILMDPERHPVPTEGSVSYALCGALAEAANAGNVAAIMTFLDRMKPEYNVLTVSLALRRESGMATMPAQPITSTPAFINWGAKYGKML